MNITKIEKQVKKANNSRKERTLTTQEIIKEIESEISKLKCKKKYYGDVIIENSQTLPNSYRYGAKFTHYKATLTKSGLIKDIEVSEQWCSKQNHGGHYYVLARIEKSALKSITEEQKEKIILEAVLKGV